MFGPAPGRKRRAGGPFLNMIEKIARLAGWLLVFAAAVLTLAPSQFRPHTPIGHHLDHVLAFAILGLMFGLGYPRHRLIVLLVGIVAVAGLETMQLWAAGRHAAFGDFFMKTLGMCAGIVLASLMAEARRRRARS
jgi:glycopeptide antibiotics resistance protein